MKGILVTGATTPVGLGLLRRLCAEPGVERILAIGIDPEDEGRELLGEDPRLEYRRVDLTRPRHLRRLLFGDACELEIDAVAHLALHRRALDGGEQVRQLNVESTRELLLLAARHPTIKRFVFRSHAEVYDVHAARPVLLSEDAPLNLRPDAPQWIRDRVAADLTVSSHTGLHGMSIAVLRVAECLAPDTGSQLYDYLQSRVCLNPAGFDPMLNVITIEDLAEALTLALRSEAEGIFAIPGGDTLPLSELVAKAGRLAIPVAGPLLAPLYWLRTRSIGTDFRYDLNRWRFHFSGVLDGARARTVLGYAPQHPVDFAGLRAR